MSDIATVGHHFITGISGTKLSDLDKRILDTLQPAGVLLLKRNFVHEVPYQEWLTSLESLLKSIREYSGKEKVIISLDHEGGRVHRTPAPLTHFPEATQYCKEPFEVAKAMALELRSIGVNVSWSPVCDIHSNPANPVIGTRAFGTAPELVSDAASKFARGLLEHGVAACAKHFPGHGDTNVDSHKELPTLHSSVEDLKNRELIPFQRLVREGIPMVMTSHILFPAIDAHYPATLSKKILKELLRGYLGFDGIIVTDDLDMNAVSMHTRPDELVVDALSAGCELFIVARHPDGTSEKPLTMAKSLLKARLHDKAIDSLCDNGYEKISRYINQSLGHYQVTELTAEQLKSHQQLSERCTSR